MIRASRFQGTEAEQTTWGAMRVESGEVTLWDGNQFTRAREEVKLQFEGTSHLVIGRAEGSNVPYLDPAFRATTVMPDGETILRGNRDIYVSRGHFMLKGAGGAMLLVNGVPGHKGRIRPPINGTMLVQPEARPMEPAEEYLILRGESVQVELPNRARISIRCE